MLSSAQYILHYLSSEFLIYFLSFLISSTDFVESMCNLMNKWVFVFESMYRAK